MRTTVLALLLGVAVLVSATSGPAAAQATNSVAGLPRVLEQFEVGDGVYVRALAIDAMAKALWVGTSVGVHEVDLGSREVRQSFTRDDGLANEYVFAIHVDRHSAKWFGTNAGGVSRFHNGSWRTWFPMHGLADYWVYSFAEHEDGTLWIGTWDGVSRYDAASDRFTNFVDELINEWVYGIAIDSGNRVWFATEGGVSMFDGSQWQGWSHDDGLGAANAQGLPPSKNTGLGTRSRHDLGVLRAGTATYNPSYVFAVHVDSDDRVWAGTWGGGVSRFDGRRWTNFSTRQGLAGNIVYSIVEDAAGTLWFGTDAGLSRFAGQDWRTYTTRDGLLDNHIYALAVAPNGDIWAGSRRGVVRVGIQ